MDGKQFDELVRYLSEGRSRRQTLKALVVGIASVAGLRARTASAGATCFGKDDVCVDDGNCCSGDCADGVCSCVGPGSVCYTVDDCCSDMRCVAGIRQDGSACVYCGEEAVCSSDDDCCAGLSCVDGACGISETVCGEAEAACTTDLHCCEGFYCFSGECIEVPVCAPLYCSARAVCCDNKVCLNGSQNPIINDGACYIRAGELCDANGDQGCETGECVDGYCGGPPACVAAGVACDVDGDCCAELICEDGTCAESGPDDGGDGDGDGGDGDGGGEETGGEDDGGNIPVALPATGTGRDTDDRNAGLLAAGIAAGTAALIVGGKRATKSAETDSNGAA